MQKFSTNADQGLKLLNCRAFYQAHEFFESAWRETNDNSREFYRALLHLSGGYFRLTQDRPEAARKFFTNAVRWMGHFPNPYFGFDTKALLDHVQNLIAAIDQKTESSMIIDQFHRPIHPENQQRSA